MGRCGADLHRSDGFRSGFALKYFQCICNFQITCIIDICGSASGSAIDEKNVGGGGKNREEIRENRGQMLWSEVTEVQVLWTLCEF